MPDRISTGRENPGVRNAGWNRPREGLQPIQEIAGAREWVPPRQQRDDSREGTGLEPLAPLPVVEGGLPPYEYQEERAPAPSINSVAAITPAVAHFVLQCVLCRRPEKECSILVRVNADCICDQCTEQAIDAVRQEIPKRRLRLALERMMQGDVTEAMVSEIEKLTGGK